MNKIRAYIDESYDELKNKVSWPTWQEVQSSSVIVLIATFIIAIIIYAMDISSSNLLKLIYKTFN